MYIGKLAKLTGTTPRAIRLYEDLGLIPSPARKGRYRVYDETHIELISIIKEAQSLGFKLSEIKKVAAGMTSCDAFPWHVAANMVKDKIQDLEDEIQSMKGLITHLNEFLSRLQNGTCQS